MNNDLAELAQRVAALEARNRRVEQDKAWETSWLRKILVAALTYAIVVVFFVLTGNDRPLLSALVPTMGYLLSTLVLTGMKQRWCARREATQPEAT